MSEKFSAQARKVMARAKEEARRFNHEYIGTEHMLLGLVAEGSGEVAAAFRALGLEESRIRQEIAALVQPGANAVTKDKLPQTPRTRQAIEFAEFEALLMKSPYVAPEHLLLGLMREPDGVASQVLRNLGLSIERLSSQVFKTRLAQSKLVERIVRPVRAGTAYKRTMREELLAHLTGIYEEELERLGDSAAAMQEAATRFGNPAELTHELESALPASERRKFYFERRFGWRAPESAARWMMRLAAQSFVLLAVLFGIGLGAGVLIAGWENFGLWWKDLRSAAAFVFVLSVTMPTVGLLYFQMRDAMFGVFGARKSLRNVFLIDGLIALVVAGSGLGYFAFVEASLTMASEILLPCSVAGIGIAIASLLTTRFTGPTEIRDTLWACLEVDDAGPDRSGPSSSAVSPAGPA